MKQSGFGINLALTQFWCRHNNELAPVARMERQDHRGRGSGSHGGDVPTLLRSLAVREPPPLHFRLEAIRADLSVTFAALDDLRLVPLAGKDALLGVHPPKSSPHLLRDHRGRHVGSARGDRRHYGGVGDAQAGDAVETQAFVIWRHCSDRANSRRACSGVDGASCVTNGRSPRNATRLHRE